MVILLVGLGSEYTPFVTSITTKADILSLEKIYGHLLTQEMRLEKTQLAMDI
jgi:hypothetical protein